MKKLFKIAPWVLAAAMFLLPMLTGCTPTRSQATPAPPSPTPTPVPPTTGYSVVDIIEFGGHDWRVLDVQDGKAFIISEGILKQDRYHKLNVGITWEDSTIRNYLNGEFLSSFSQADQARIIETTVINNNNPTYDTPGGNNTVDKIFLLSIDEAEQYFANDSARVAYDSIGVSRGRFWWLRSPGSYPYRAAFVHGDGSIGHDGKVGDFDYIIDFGTYVYGGDFGVRPALWLNLD